MNWQQLSAVILLRWQMSRNQWRKAGQLNAVLMSLLALLVLMASVIAFFGSLVGGFFLLPEAKPEHLLILWDVVVAGFLFFWMFGLLTELQRSELLSLDRLLHLPVSLFGAFLLNYLSSLASLSLAVFVPLVIGLNLALVVTHGPAMLLVFPLIAGFLLMVTGITYYFRGWLAQLMENKRRRGTVMAIITIVFILLAQAPNLINLAYVRSSQQHNQQVQLERQREQELLREQLRVGAVTPEEFTRRMQELTASQQKSREDRLKTSIDQGLGWLRFGNLVLPIGWLPLGVSSLAEGRFLPPVLGALAMLGIGFVSLRRSYSGTMKSYTHGGGSSQAPRSVPVTAPRQRKLWLARTIPGIPETVSTVAIASLTSAIRSPEGKMMLLSPIFFLGMIAMILFMAPTGRFPAEAFAPVGMATIGATLLSLVQFLFNSFGTDRAGFRAYILMPIERREILMGKNLSLLPLMLGLDGILLTVLAIAFPMHPSHLPATLIQASIAFGLTCLVGNTLSIYVPITLPTGSFRPHNIRMIPMLMQFLGTLLLPMSLLPAVASWGVEFAIETLTDFRWIPWYLLLSVVEAALFLGVYLMAVSEQGKWLHRRETQVLQTVAAAAE